MKETHAPGQKAGSCTTLPPQQDAHRSPTVVSHLYSPPSSGSEVVKLCTAGFHLVLRKAGEGGAGEKAPSREATPGKESGGWFRHHPGLGACTPGSGRVSVIKGPRGPQGRFRTVQGGRRAECREQLCMAPMQTAEGMGPLHPQPVLYTRPESSLWGE